MLVGIFTLELDGGQWLASSCTAALILWEAIGVSLCRSWRTGGQQDDSGSDAKEYVICAGSLNISSVIGHLTEVQQITPTTRLLSLSSSQYTYVVTETSEKNDA
jgi:hypothetical protein